MRAEAEADPAAAEKQSNLALAQLGLALRNLKPNCWLMPIMSAIVCVMFARWVSTPALVVWFIVWAPRSRSNPRVGYQEPPAVEGRSYPSTRAYTRDDVYEDDYPR